MTAQHQKLAQGKWFAMTLVEQLGNVGSEFERALRWKEKNQQLMFSNAAKRTLELLDLSLADPRWHTRRLKELATVRKLTHAQFYGDTGLSEDAEALKKYFFQFAMLARQGR